MAEQERFDNYLRWITDYLCHAKAELSTVEMDQLYAQLLRQHPRFKAVVQQATFQEVRA